MAELFYSSHQKPRRIRRETWAAIGFIFGGLFLLGLFLLTLSLAWISRDLPDPNTLLTRTVPLSTRIYDRTGTHLLYEVHGEENRTLVQVKNLPAYVGQATIAIEDKNFYYHGGISWQGLVRAVLSSILHRGRISGTSTLTQQFVKNAVLTNERSLIRKMKEFLMSMQIERVYSKDQILQMYLNEIPYGSTVYGIESASQMYFGKPAKDLTLDEAALLASIPQAPDTYSPYGTGSRGDHRDLLIGRQHTVLDDMAEQGYVTKSQAEEAKKIDVLKKLSTRRIGNISAPHFVMYVRGLLTDKYGQETVEQKGLKVITTLDWDKQQMAEDEIKKNMEARAKKYNFTNTALVALDPKTEQILSMVGSADFFDVAHDGQVNVALSARQPGSSFKPIVYLAGFLKGFTPEMTLWDVDTTFKTDTKDYSPKDYDLKERGPLPVRSALQGSLNIPAVKMLYLTGVSTVLDFASDKLGYTTFHDRSRFGLSVVLGGAEVKLLEHVTAYATFANQGVRFPTSAILKVEDATGATVEEWKQPDGVSTVDKNAVAALTDVLSDNAARAYVFGPSNFLTLPDRPVAAKTGTTNDFHDAWTVGYVPSLAVGVWVGNNNNDPMKKGSDGSQVAAPVWQGFMKRALKGTKPETFPASPPNTATSAILHGTANSIVLAIDKSTGQLATPLTPANDIENRIFHEAHDTLYYLDKDNPTGPRPEHPEQDPQYSSWEAAAQSWAKRTNWNTTSTPPIDEAAHDPKFTPTVTILSPAQNETLNIRSSYASVQISAPRTIVRLEASIDGQPAGIAAGGATTITFHVPGSVERGFHDLRVAAIDDVGNRGSSTVTLNIATDPETETLAIDQPATGFVATSSSFPLIVIVRGSTLANAQKTEIYLAPQDGIMRLWATIPMNGSTALLSVVPEVGTYNIIPVATFIDGQTLVGESVQLNVK